MTTFIARAIVLSKAAALFVVIGGIGMLAEELFKGDEDGKDCGSKNNRNAEEHVRPDAEGHGEA